MSVVIRGMKMPKDCTECRFAYDGMCLANWGRKSKIDVTNYCPLVELPPHGRLIDADVTNKILSLLKDLTSTEDYMGIGYNHGVVDSMTTIKNTPTIIEAEEVEG